MSRLKGDQAEQKACEFLNTQGFNIIEQNYYAKKLGEIDIIAIKNRVYHFVEVKSAKDYETAINNINPTKISKLKKSIEYYLQNKKLDTYYCIDAIIVIDEDIEFIENITF